MDVLWEVVQNIHFGESGRAYVVSRNGRVVAHTDPEIVLRNATIQEQPEFAAMSSAPNNEWSGTYTNFENTSVVGYTSHIPGTDWLIITERPLGEAFSATAVQDRIRNLVQAEAVARTLSDDKIVSLLNAEGIDIARRTVAKYREGMGIPSSVERRRLKGALTGKDLRAGAGAGRD
jgi:hypothetical protein